MYVVILLFEMRKREVLGLKTTKSSFQKSGLRFLKINMHQGDTTGRLGAQGRVLSGGNWEELYN